MIIGSTEEIVRESGGAEFLLTGIGFEHGHRRKAVEGKIQRQL